MLRLIGLFGQETEKSPNHISFERTNIMYGTLVIPFAPLIAGIILGWRTKQMASPLFWISSIGVLLLVCGTAIGFVAERKILDSGLLVTCAALGLLAGVVLGLASLLCEIGAVAIYIKGKLGSGINNKL